MGLFNTTHLHEHHTTHVTESPKNITVNENKAPTDESIRLLNEFQEKTIDNIVARIKVEDNILNGEILIFAQPMLASVKLVCKFSINGKEFIVERELDSREYEWNDDVKMNHIKSMVTDYSKQIMAFYALKYLSIDMFNKITGNKGFDENKLIESICKS